MGVGKRNVAKLTHNHCVYGDMGGIVNRKLSGRSSMNRVASRLTVPDFGRGCKGARKQQMWMKDRNLLSRNPLCSGGVGRIRMRCGTTGGHPTISNSNVNNDLLTFFNRFTDLVNFK